MIDKLYMNLREKSPLIHCITNYVTVNDVANILLATGASPIMSDEPEEVEEITSGADALYINIGTLNQRTIEAMFRSAGKARKLNHPIVIDPVGAAASKLRRDTVQTLLDSYGSDVIRGNISELRCLAGYDSYAKGVDAAPNSSINEDSLKASKDFLMKFADSRNCIAAATGAIDIVTDGKTCYAIRNGRPEMSRITGTGCQSSALIAAFLAANPDCRLEAVTAALCMMGFAGEIGFGNLLDEGNAGYRNRIIDAVYNMDAGRLLKGSRYQII